MREPSSLEGAGRVTTGVWPAFPTDMVSLVTVLATQARGSTLVHDWLYELRLFGLEQLSGMGADLFLCDPHRIVVTGPRRLRGRPLDSRDLRSGMALVVAALCADGESRVEPLETIERGYAQPGRATPEPRRESTPRGRRSIATRTLATEEGQGDPVPARRRPLLPLRDWLLKSHEPAGRFSPYETGT